MLLSAALLSQSSSNHESRYDAVFRHAGHVIGVDWNRLKAQALAENSTFDPYAESSVGAVGCAQFLPKTWDWLNEKYALNWHIENCKQSLLMQALYMRYLMNRCDSAGVAVNDHWDCAVLAYNHGEGNLFAKIRKAGGFALSLVDDVVETKKYRRVIGRLWKRLRRQ